MCWSAVVHEKWFVVHASSASSKAGILLAHVNHHTRKSPKLQELYAVQDVAAGVAGVQEIATGAKEAVMESVVTNVEAQMSTDRKTTALKFLQGLIWTEGPLLLPLLPCIAPKTYEQNAADFL